MIDYHVEILMGIPRSPGKLRMNPAGLMSGVSFLGELGQKKILLEMFLQTLRLINEQEICSHGHHVNKLGDLSLGQS